jgi:inner membrane protein
MLWRTHFIAGATAGLLISGATQPKTALLAAGVSGIAALMPDIDSPVSKIGCKVPILSWLIRVTVGHRGVFHSLLAALVFSATLSLFPLLESYFWPLFYGYVSHLLMDALNPEGVPLFWPLPIRVSIPLVHMHTGGVIEKLVFGPVVAVVFCMICFTRFV